MQVIPLRSARKGHHKHLPDAEPPLPLLSSLLAQKTTSPLWTVLPFIDSSRRLRSPLLTFSLVTRGEEVDSLRASRVGLLALFSIADYLHVYSHRCTRGRFAPDAPSSC